MNQEKQKEKKKLSLTNFCNNFLNPSTLKNFLPLILLFAFTFQMTGCGRGGEGLKCHDSNGAEISCGNDQGPDDTGDNGDDGGNDNGGGDDGGGNGNGDDDLVFEDILENETVEEKVSLGILRPGDRLYFTIEGVEEWPQFTGEYIRSYKSTWEEKICIPDPLLRDLTRPNWPPGIKSRDCFWFPKNGTCNHKYNDQKENKKGIIQFSDEVKNLKLKLKIGDEVYNLGVIKENQGHKLKTEFFFSGSVMTEPQEVELFVKKFKETRHQVGFKGFLGCDGFGKRNFKTEGHINSSTVTVRIKQSFKVSLKVSYKP